MFGWRPAGWWSCSALCGSVRRACRAATSRRPLIGMTGRSRRVARPRSRCCGGRRPSTPRTAPVAGSWWATLTTAVAASARGVPDFLSLPHPGSSGACRVPRVLRNRMLDPRVRGRTSTWQPDPWRHGDLLHDRRVSGPMTLAMTARPRWRQRWRNHRVIALTTVSPRCAWIDTNRRHPL